MKLHFDSDTDTHYVLSKYTEFPLEKLHGFKVEEETSPINGFTYTGTEFHEYEELNGVQEQVMEA